MPKLIKYRIYCITDQKFEYIWLEDDKPKPTKCPNNPTHEINLNSITIDETTETLSVKIQEEEGSTGGNFRLENICFDCEPNKVSEYSFSFPINISVLAFKILLKPDMANDFIHGVISPNTIVGSLIQDAKENDTILHVSDSVIENTFVGMMVNLYDSSNNIFEQGQIIGKTDDTIIIEDKLTQDYSSGSFIGVGVSMVKNVKIPDITSDILYSVGSTKIGASFLKANTETKIYYTNNSNEKKTCHILYEYLY
jgi:hypothetical protein